MDPWKKLTSTVLDGQEIDGSPIRCTYRSRNWKRSSTEYIVVTRDGRIWLVYPGYSRCSHLGNVGDRGTSGTSRDEILHAANSC